MPGQDEFIGSAEQVIAIVGKEGEVPRPEDTRCRASVKGKQCKNEISYDEAGDNWSAFCVKHREEDAAARESGKPRVARFLV